MNITTNNMSKEKEWSLSIEENGISKTTRVEEILDDSGKTMYLVRKSKYGKPADGGKDAEYIDETSKIVMATNPLAPKPEKTSEEKTNENLDAMRPDPASLGISF